MRLLDLIAHGRSEAIRTPDGSLLPGADRFASAVRNCPLRYVMSDELARCSMQLAYAEGDRLDSCLDLIRAPAQSLWVEWSDAPRRDELLAVSALAIHGGSDARRAGALVTAALDGRSGELRTFWSTVDDLAYVSPVVAQFDFAATRAIDPTTDPFSPTGWSCASAPAELGLDRTLEHVRFRFEPMWGHYYQRTCSSEAMRTAVLRANLGTCAFDPPMLFALFLMLGARDALPRRAIVVDRLNRRRTRAGKLPLLEHIELSAPPFATTRETSQGDLARSERQSPRFHHVRGHIVRRGATVFWRCPHVRGCARLGQVRSRTVELSFATAHRRRDDARTG